MVRRRSASPQSSAPVRSVHRPAPAAPARHAAPPTPMGNPASMHAPPPGAAPSRGPGLMGQMAATAGGVAIGSAVGHAVGGMFTGGSNNHAPQEAAAPAGAPQQQFSNTCEFEWKQFIECTQSQSDVGLCNGFNEAFKQCKSRYA